MSIFADVQCCIYAGIVGWVVVQKKVQKYADVIYGWSLFQNMFRRALILPPIIWPISDIFDFLFGNDEVASFKA